MAKEEEEVGPAPEIQIGADLSMMSIEDLEKRITVLDGEIERIRTAISNKRRSRDAADSFFRR